MAFDYVVKAAFNGEEYAVGVETYLGAWTVYRTICDMFPKEAVIDIVDNTNGEVFESNRPDWE